jgi:WW domain-containing oxidoreductase
MSLLSAIKRHGPTGFGYGSSADQVTEGLDLRSKTILLTGCNSGLGLETLRVLSRRGARVLGTARSEAKAAAAAASALATEKSVPLGCDLAEPDSVRSCVAQVKRLGVKLDAIICNAGVMALPRLAQAHGYELQFFTNHIGHFLLVTGLLNELGEHGRVVMVSSEAHKRTPRGGIELDNLSGARAYNPWRAYGQSKLANLLFARELAKRLPHVGQRANAVHPGVIATNLTRSLPGWAQAGFRALAPLALKSVEEGAATQCYVAVHPGAIATGEYFIDCNIAVSSPAGRDPALAARLWAASERIVGEL